MTDDVVRAEIAFIRRAIEEGRGYASGRGGDLLVWGVAMALAHLGTYVTVRGWWPIDLRWLWAMLLVLPWSYSLRWFFRQSAGQPAMRPMAWALQMEWFACGIFLTTLAVAASYAGEMSQGWFNAVSAGVLGVGFFTSSYLCNLPWMRWVGIAWWAGELAAYALRREPEVLALMAVLMVLLLALPGLILLRTASSPKPDA
jgi:hypothetical protein